MESVRSIREHAGISQAKLAVLADMNPVTVWRIETGQRSPTVDQLERLAEVLGVEVNDFFPKAHLPLQFEASELAAGEVAADTMAVVAGRWLEELDEKWETIEENEKQQYAGRGYAAIEIRDALIKRRHDEGLSIEQANELDVFIGILNRVVNKLVERIEADTRAAKARTEVARKHADELANGDA